MTKSVDLTRLLKKEHSQKWVAVSPDYKKVVGYSEDLLKLRNEVGKKEVVYFKVPESGRRYAF